MTQKRKWGNRRSVRTEISDEFTLRPWHEVARLFQEKTGEKLTRSGAWVIGQRAIGKIRDALSKGRVT